MNIFIVYLLIPLFLLAIGGEFLSVEMLIHSNKTRLIERSNGVSHYESRRQGNSFSIWIPFRGNVVIVGKHSDQFVIAHELFHAEHHVKWSWLVVCLSLLLFVSLYIYPELVPELGLLWFLITILLLWRKKLWEREADIHAFKATGSRYIGLGRSLTPSHTASSAKLVEWLISTHPPSNIRESRTYYDESIPLRSIFWRDIRRCIDR